MTESCRERGFGELYVDGDIACEHGDVAALSAVAQHLIEHVAEPLHCELAPLAAACKDPRRAADAWSRLKERLEALR